MGSASVKESPASLLYHSVSGFSAAAVIVAAHNSVLNAIPSDFIRTPKFYDWYKISPGNAVKTAPASK